MGAIFSADIQKFIDKAKGNLDTVVRKVSLDMFRKVITKSPVDTGRFKGNWNVGINTMVPGFTATLDESGISTIARMSAEVLQAKAGDVINLTNNMPYAARLEYGWSDQAPTGMVRLTVQEFGMVVSQAVNEVPK